MPYFAPNPETELVSFEWIEAVYASPTARAAAVTASDAAIAYALSH